MPRELKIKNILIKIDKTRDLLKEINVEKFIFPIFRPLQQLNDQKHDFSVDDFRHVLSNEKAKILATIKSKNPTSIYGLAKLLNRDFKAVHKDIKILENFGFIKLLPEKIKNKKSLRPVIAINKLNITIEI
jgi:predicted transcriptional regulator